MTIEELTQILQKRNVGKIKRELKSLGYINCVRDKRYRNINLCDIAAGEVESTEFFDLKTGKTEIVGDICTQIKCCPGVEFVLVNINKIYPDKDLSFPVKILIYAREG